MLTGRQRLRSGILYIRVFYRPQVDDATRSRDGVIGIIPAIISPTQVTPMGPLDILLSMVKYSLPQSIDAPKRRI